MGMRMTRGCLDYAVVVSRSGTHGARSIAHRNSIESSLLNSGHAAARNDGSAVCKAWGFPSRDRASLADGMLLSGIVPGRERWVPCPCFRRRCENPSIRREVWIDIELRRKSLESSVQQQLTASPLQEPEYQTAFRTLKSEINVDALLVEGAFPDWLDGALLRNGPAMFEAGDQLLHHQFDGPAMFHRFGFNGGRVSYANRFCHTPMLSHIREKGMLGDLTFGTPTSDSVREVMRQQGPNALPRVNPNVTFMQLEEALFATCDGQTLPVQIDRETLEVKGLHVWDDDLQTHDCAGNAVGEWRYRGTTGHWHEHPVDGSAINYFVQPAEGGRSESYNFFRIPKGTKQREPVATVPTDQSAMIHAFCVTERYIVLPESPLRVDGQRIPDVGVLGALHWRAGTPMYLHVVDMIEKKHVRTFEVRPSYVMHTINAYEDGDEIVLDMGVYDNGDHVWELALNPAARPAGGLFPQARTPELRSHGRPFRYRLNMKTGAASEELIADVCIELATIDYASRNGRPYNHFYSTGIDKRPETRFYNQISSVNLSTGICRTFSEDKHYLGEAVFVPKPGRRSESDGVLLSVGLDGAKGRSYLLALEPTTLTPIAKAHVPHAIPSGFHGMFFGRKV
jgi:beta,beta-carotene 9',10'-dioxygenase